MAKIDDEMLSKLAELEVAALYSGLQDEELKRNPAFLDKVRKFLQQNNLKTQPETPGVSTIQKEAVSIPVFDVVEGGRS